VINLVLISILENIMKTLSISTLLKAFWQEECGLTMVEYAVAGSLITLGAAAAFTGLGTAVSNQIAAITLLI
jgi:pilus assembly protein Flp/PilA